MQHDLLEALHLANILKLRLELLETLDIILAACLTLLLLLVIGLQLILEHAHLATDSQQSPCNDRMPRLLHCITMLNLLLADLRELSD